MEARENLRGSGILLSISSLPSPYGIGTLGREAYNFVDLLGDLKQKYWQVLPVGPTIFGDSPYQPSSGCAGNIYFIDLDKLADEGLLEREEILGYNWGTDQSEIDYAALHQNRYKILQKAFERFDTNAQEFQDFVKKHSGWLEQYALFMTLKTDNLDKIWSEWPSEYKNPQAVALEKYQKKNYNTITFWKFCQYKFFQQWEDLKNYANSKGIYIIGDASFYVGYDSVDVWAERQLFMMSANDTPEYVAAAAPDKYSENGQVWGNPMYDWDAMKEDNFSWWRKRMRVCRELFDIVRIDHFAGIVKAYAVPYGQDKSLSGKWFKGAPAWILLGLAGDLQPPDAVLFTFRHAEAAVAGCAGHVLAAGFIVHQDGEGAFGLLFGSGQEHQNRLGAGEPASIDKGRHYAPRLQLKKPMSRQTARPPRAPSMPLGPMPAVLEAMPKLWAQAAPTMRPTTNTAASLSPSPAMKSWRPGQPPARAKARPAVTMPRKFHRPSVWATRPHEINLGLCKEK